jgi:hypothetical protein
MPPIAGFTSRSSFGSTFGDNFSTISLEFVASNLADNAVSYFDSDAKGGFSNTVLPNLTVPFGSFSVSNQMSSLFSSITLTISVAVDGFLTPHEIEDVLASREERKNGEGKVFSNVDDLFAWLDSE